MAEKVSPEEKLFNIIKEGKDSGSGGGVSKQKNSPAMFLGLKNFFGSLKLRLGAHKSQVAAQGSFPFHDIDPKAVNKVLVVVTVITGIIFIIYIGGRRTDISKIEASIPKTRPAGKSSIEPFKPLETYISAVKQRDIFKPVPKEVPKTETGSQISQTILKEAARSLKIVGISWGENPKVLIREDKAKETYFVQKGQTIGTTGIEVKDIAKNKVTIGYQGEEMELQ